jgi:hypothetical protein
MDDIEAQLSLVTIGLSKDLAKSMGAVAIDSIQRVDVLSNTWHERLTDEIKLGRQLYQCVLQMIKYHNPVFLDIVRNNFSIEDFLSIGLSDLASYDRQIDTVMSEVDQLELPDPLYYTYEA